MIPTQLQDSAINFCLVNPRSKHPVENGWSIKDTKFNDSKLIDWLNQGGNYGIRGGGEKHLLIIDSKKQELQDKLEKGLPETFTVKTGSGKHHLYYFSDESETYRIFGKTGYCPVITVQGFGKCVVGPGSTHPNGNKYEVVKDIPIAFLSYAEIKEKIFSLVCRRQKK